MNIVLVMNVRGKVHASKDGIRIYTKRMIKLRFLKQISVPDLFIA